MAQWSELFGLRCESYDQFLSFYSKTKGLIHKLKTNNSIAVTDDTFLKAYFAKVIDAPELQQEVKKFSKGGTQTYDAILELIHSDYRAQETGEALRDTNPSVPSALRRGKYEDKIVTIKEPTPVVVRFPPNRGQMIASHIYVQVRDWFKQMIIPESDRSQEDKDWSDNFKFNLYSNAYKCPRRDFNDCDRGGGREQKEI